MESFRNLKTSGYSLNDCIRAVCLVGQQQGSPGRIIVQLRFNAPLDGFLAASGEGLALTSLTTRIRGAAVDEDGSMPPSRIPKAPRGDTPPRASRTKAPVM